MSPPRWRSSASCPWVLCLCVTSQARSRGVLLEDLGQVGRHLGEWLMSPGHSAGGCRLADQVGLRPLRIGGGEVVAGVPAAALLTFECRTGDALADDQHVRQIE